MIFSCLVSRSAKRAPFPWTCEADDEACAAFAAWCEAGAGDRPHVRPIANNCWLVTDGFTTIKVQILEQL